jgi:serine/threonine protein kinase
MGVVYLGESQDGHQVAVKVLRPELADNPEFRVRFGREVSTLTRVRGVCTIGVIEADTEAPTPFLVTEYADGPSLHDGHAVRPGERELHPDGRDQERLHDELQLPRQLGAERVLAAGTRSVRPKDYYPNGPGACPGHHPDVTA